MESQTTLLQIDVQNLFFESRIRNQKIDFEKIIEHFNSRESEFLTDSIAYIIQNEDAKKFENKLKNIGFKIKSKNFPKTIKAYRYAQNWSCPKCSRAFKGIESRISETMWHSLDQLCPQCAELSRSLSFNISYHPRDIDIDIGAPHYHDVEITIDCMDRIDSFNKWVFISGNGDMLDLCRYLKQKGKKIEVWNFKECSNSLIETYADKINIINESFVYKRPIVQVFGFNQGLERGSNEV
jgi:uncharacterized LabA/DUF88 family protein